MKFNKIIFSFLTLFSVASCTANPETPLPEKIETKITNPIIYADCPDPSVVRDGNYIYIFGTGGRVYRADVTEETLFFEQLPDVKRSDSWGASPTAIWAPDVYKIGDKWNYYYSNSVWGGEDTAGIGVMTSDSLEGPWEDKGKIFDSQEIGVMNSIDSCVYSEDGRNYMVWGSFRGLYLIELNEDGTALKSPVSQAANEKVLIAGIVGPWNGGTYEGLYLRKINGYYYLFGSQGTCCAGVNSTYHVKVARSTSITGPYVDSDGVDMLGTDRGELVIQSDQNVAGTGHMSLLQDDEGTWFMVYHGYDKFNPGAGRVVFMDELMWDDNGFPYVLSYKATYNKEINGPVFNTENKE